MTKNMSAGTKYLNIFISVIFVPKSLKLKDRKKGKEKIKLKQGTGENRGEIGKEISPRAGLASKG
jgi:hypothetical protein